MSTMTNTGFRKIVALVMIVLLGTGNCHLAAAGVRAPVFAGRFYPSTRLDLDRAITRLVTEAEVTDLTGIAGLNLKALIIPHAGYMYSGFTAAHGSRSLAGRRFSKVIVMGPDHRVGIRTAAISAVDAYDTPLGRIDLHPDSKRLRKQSNLFAYSPVSDRTEHSLEVVLPFLQYSLGNFQMVPLVIGGAQPLAIANALEAVLDNDTLVVASSDLSHFLPYHQAVAWDRDTLELIKRLEPEKLMARQNSACGRAPIAVILHLARLRDWRPVVLNYTNSGDTAGDREKVVGYAAIAFFKNNQTFFKNNQTGRENPMENCFRKENGAVLLNHARKTITEKLGLKFDRESADRLAENLQAGCFDTKSGTFVTLTLNGQLRGCIGNMSSTVNLRDGVRQNAISAAFHDPRFSPLTDAELARIHIEISILTEPRALAHNGGEDLVRKLRPDIDGVILSKGPKRATFLPQVWKQLPRPEDFLNHLCMKAGLPANTWQSETLDAQTYQVISFEEEP
ncbi:MAG: AmmeMemoRadiSam system protein B [Desulfobacterales bacterium]|nr:AmmeMemoRadiSam system protein B [Desulfobacterales bacterium]